MVGQGNFTAIFAKALLAATTERQLVDPRKKKPGGPSAITSEQIARMERELASLQNQVKSVEDTYGVDNLHLTVAKGYVAKLLANKRIVRWLAQGRPEYLTEFQVVAEIETIGNGKIAAE
jgi:RepB plasmid partitioning protein